MNDLAGLTIVDVGYRSTHYHIDHAGLAQELKRAGMDLLVCEVQVDAIPQMKRWTKPRDHYVDITLDDNVVIACDESRAMLAAIDIPGEIVPTPGHSDDSVSLLLDDGAVFTGDLTHPGYIPAGDPDGALASWHRLVEMGARRVYPAHGPVWSLDPAIV